MNVNKTLFGIFLTLFVSTNLLGQVSSLTRNVICFTPTKANKINGLTIGIWNKPNYDFQKFNGVNIELIGQGWLTPFFGLDNGRFIEKTEKKHIINGVTCGLTLFNGKVNGLTVSPLINTTYYSNGLKLSLINVDLYITNGIQIGLLNFSGKVNGLTVSPIINTTCYTNGLKLSLINVDIYKTNGLQMGLINFNEINNGLTIGIYNKAKTVKGLQFGLVNRTENLSGLQFGLININKSRTTIIVNWRTKKE